MSFSFSKTSKERLETCHPDLITLFNEVIERVDCTIICGHRSRDDQNFAFVRGMSKVQWPDSSHNSVPSMAADVAPYFKDVQIDWKDVTAFAFFAGRVMEIADRLYEAGEMSHRVKWGGDWDGDGRTRDHSFMDAPHFELIEEGE